MNALYYGHAGGSDAPRNAYPQPQSKPRPNKLEELDYYGNTALLKACYQGKTDQVAGLIRSGANIKAVNFFGQNALTLAAYSGNCELIQLLLRYRTYADFNSSSIVPAICVAALRQDAQMMQYLRRLDRHSDIKTSHGLRPDDIYTIFAPQQRGFAPKPSFLRIL